MTPVPPPTGPTYRICFVCTGNICRSPIAEVVLRRLVEDAGLAGSVEVDSAGTGAWHLGDGADPRAVDVLRSSGYDGSAHRARAFAADWFADRDLVVALDRGHLRTLTATARDETERGKVRLLRSFDPDAPPQADVADPYYGDARDFAEVLDQVERACRGLLDEVSRVLDDSAVPGS
jgi:protein-tyrosine phosphatase